ncbi:MAG: hypothetical protein ABIN67_11565 [Ferruginibacter sp.]
MQTITVEITNNNALKVLQELQEKHFINIIPEPDLNAAVFPGKPLTTKEFKDFIDARENGKSLTLKEAKIKWQKKKKQLLKL